MLTGRGGAKSPFTTQMTDGSVKKIEKKSKNQEKKILQEWTNTLEMPSFRVN